MTHARTLALTLVLVAISGCSSPARSPVDAASNDDAASAVDSGGTPLDMGLPNDAFVGVDAATPVDMGSSGGACTNSADTAVIAAGNVGTVVGNCAMNSFGREPATQDCIRSMSGLTMACADCYDGEVRCTTMHCLSQCIGGNTPACNTCRMTNCDPAFTVCSGVAP